MKLIDVLKTALLCIALLFAGQSQAELKIKITQGVEGALPIAIAPFAWEGKSGAKAPELIDEIVGADLARSGQFRTRAAQTQPQQAVTAQTFKSTLWRQAGVESVVIGTIREDGPEQYTVQFRLFDTIQGRQLLGHSFPARQSQLREAAHKISDLIYEKLIGQRGAFNTRMAYITTQIVGKKKTYLLQVADADGYNPQTILESPKPMMSPAWAPDGRRLAYVSFEDNRAAIYIQDIFTGEKTRLPAHRGINGAPAFSPDGRHIAMTLSESGNPEIYVMDLQSKHLKRLTNNRSIDTEAAWMPDGRSLIFTSDRSGRPQLYKVSLNGGAAERLTFEGEYNSDADISPDGTKIAMVHGNDGVFRIAVLDLQSGYVRVLTDGRLDEAPSFAPNASMIIYATVDQGQGVLAAVSEDGRVHQQLVLTEGEVREPVWSPFKN